MHITIGKALAVCLLCLTKFLSLGQSSLADDGQETDDTLQIQAAIESYVAAFNAKDVATLVELWSPDGVYISRSSGEQLVGREVMTKEFSEQFGAETVPQLAVETESIDFVSPNVAIERGLATVTYGADEISETSYRVVYVKRDGKWLIDRVTEESRTAADSHAEQLKELEWLIGDWVDVGEGVSIDMSCQWARNRNYISRKYQVHAEGLFSSSGLQIIGWDAAKQQICSWLFDSEGGFVKGTWTKSDDQWVVQSVATLADGAEGSFTSIFRPTDDGNYTWRKINRVVDGKLLPNLEEIVVQRK